MLLDAEVTLDPGTSHIQSEATANYIDLAAARDIGAGRELYVVSVLTTALTGGTSMTLTLETDDNTSFSSATSIQTIGAFATSGSAAGQVLIARIAPIATPERYLRGYWTESGAVTVGVMETYITDNIDRFRAYANGYTIS